MTDSVASAAEFECLMAKRAKANAFHGNISVLVGCDVDGRIADKDRRRVCELQKLALGSDTAYVLCGPVERLSRDIWWLGKPVAKKGDLVREVRLHLSPKEHEELRPFIVPLCEGTRALPDIDPFGGLFDAPGVACVFPGGCD